jgi:ATP adenylyltransferase
MDYLFTPWRFSYVATPRAEGECILCFLAASDPADDPKTYVLKRAEHCYLVLNLFPYNTAHLMIVPYAHVSRLSHLAPAALDELTRTAARAEAVIEEVYRPEGINMGINLGASAGAGIAEHLHLHVVPRWGSETRVLPEDLPVTWRKLQGKF